MPNPPSSKKLILLALLIFCCNAFGSSLADREPRNYLISPLYHSSHWRPQVLIAKELVARGNNVTFLLAKEFYGNELPESEFNFAKVEFYSAGFGPEKMRSLCRSANDIQIYDLPSWLKFGTEFNEMMTSSWKSEFTAIVNKFRAGAFDTLISDVSPVAMALCSNAKNVTCFASSPFVLRNPDSEFFVVGTRGLPFWFPMASMGLKIPETYVERIRTQLLKSAMKIITSIMFEPMEFAKEIEMTKYSLQPVLINSFSGFDWNIPLPPHVKYIGPLGLEKIELAHDKIEKNHEDYLAAITSGISADEADKLVGNDDLFSWIERNPVIAVVSFGKSVELAASQFQILVDFAAAFEGAVLWSVRKHQLDLMPKLLPDNLRIETWIAYAEVISHPNIKLVICQCGVASAHEAVIAEVPLLCIPILFDQYDLAALVAHHKVGDVIWKEGWSSREPLLNVSRTIIANEQEIRANARKLHLLAKHTKPSMGEVVDWIETVEIVGKEYFLPPINVQAVKFYEFDELAYTMYFLVAFLTFVLTKWGCFCCCCCFRRSSKKFSPKIKKE